MLEHTILLRLAEPRVQRQYLQRRVVAQRLGQFPDIALAGQENQDIPAGTEAAGVDCIDQAGDLRRGSLLGIGLTRLEVVGLDRIGATGHLDDRGAAEVAGKTVHVDGGRGDDQLEIRPLRQHALEVAQQEIDIETALVGLVDDNRVIG